MSETPVDAVDTETDTTPEPEAQPERYGAPLTASVGQDVLHVTPDNYLDVVRAAHDDGFAMCADLCAVDQLTNGGRPLPESVEPQRFEVVVNLLSFDPPRRLRIRVQVPEADPRVPTLFPLYPGTEAMEREAFDLVGILFDEHPDLTRILLPEDWEGHPLRKDSPVGRIPVQFKAAPSTR